MEATMQKDPMFSFSSDSMIQEQLENTKNDVFVTISKSFDRKSEEIIERKKIIPSNNCESEYSGDVVNGKMHGQGMLSGSAGTYVGEFKNGEANGKGMYYFQFGAKYEGEWQDDVRHGFGVLTLPGGYPRYEGEWRNDEICGSGKMFRSDGGVVEGVFDGNFNGIGSIVYPDGNKYKGQFRHGERNGMGVLITPENEKFTGEFHGLIPWEGVMVAIDGREYKLEDGTPVAEIHPETGELYSLIESEIPLQQVMVQ